MAAWERVTSDNGTTIQERTERMSVEGGWLYRTTQFKYNTGSGYAIATAMVFVPSLDKRNPNLSYDERRRQQEQHRD